MRLPTLLLLLPLLFSCTVPLVQVIPDRAPIPVPDGVQTVELEMGPLLTRLTPGESLIKIQYGWLCAPAPSRDSPSGRLPFTRDDLIRAFRSVLGPLNYRLAKEPDSVFLPTTSADLRIGGTITKLSANVCFPFSGSPTLTQGDSGIAKRSAFVEVQWELYSAIEGQVVFKGTTQGTFVISDSVQGGSGTIVLNAVKRSMGNLAADPAFHVIASRPSIPRKITTPGGQST